MVRLKLSKEEFDPKALDVKVEPPTHKRYRGEVPPNNTILIIRVTRLWWTQSKAGDPQIYLNAFAEQNTGQLKKYNGLPIREYLTFNPDNAFRYMPFLNLFGITTRDIFGKMDVEDEPDKIGDVIKSIGGWVVGSDDALCRVALIRDYYNPDEVRAKVDVDGWMPLEDVDEDEDEDDIDDEDEEEEDEPPARPTSTRGGARTRQAKPSSRGRRAEPKEDDEDEDDEYDEDEDIDDETEEAEAEDQDEEDEEDEEEAPPARSSRSARTSRTAARPTRSSRTRSAPASRGDGQRTRSSRTSTARSERTPGPRGSTGRDGGSREDPPF
jgi:hypothetical protein